MKVMFFAYIRDYTKCKEMDIDNCSTIEDLLHSLCEIYGEKFSRKVFVGEDISGEIIILINGRHIAHLKGAKSELRGEDEISIFPVVAGG